MKPTRASHHAKPVSVERFRFVRENVVMRFLTIVRHAKAEKASPGQSDFDRALTERGRTQCQQLRDWATSEDDLAKFGPTTALVSSATRTRETFQLAFEGTAFVSSAVF